MTDEGDRREVVANVDEAVWTAGEVDAVDDAAGTAEVLPPWLSPRDEGEETLPWTRPRGR